MNITRLYTGTDNHSYFEEIEIELFDKGEIGRLSKKFPVSGVIFRENDEDYDYDFHNAPERQFIVMLDGKIMIETSRNIKRIFKIGDIILVEDTEGFGHRTKNLGSKKRHSLFIILGDNDVKLK